MTGRKRVVIMHKSSLSNSECEASESMFVEVSDMHVTVSQVPPSSTPIHEEQKQTDKVPGRMSFSSSICLLMLTTIPHPGADKKDHAKGRGGW